MTPTHYSLPLYTAPDYSAYKSYGDYTADWQPLRVQPTAQPWRFECTGKIRGNGRYEITFVKTRGTNALRLGDIRVLKRGEVVATVSQNALTAPAVTIPFTVSNFEAGTPFYVEIMANGEGGNDSQGLVFIRKIGE